MVTSTLHPAQARRMQAKLPPQDHHDVVLRALGNASADPIITMDSENFVDVLMEDLKADDWQARLDQRRPQRTRRRSSMLELEQPIHKKMQIALFEVYCLTPGLPPVDPRKVVGSGLVLRRISGRGDAPMGDLGWVRAGAEAIGWQPLGTALELDPDPSQRHSVAKSAPELLKQVSANRQASDAIAEEIIPLNIAPPDVCAARGKTILYGVIPVSSAERAGANETPVSFGAAGTSEDDNPFVATLSIYLKQRSRTAMPYAGQTLQPRRFIKTDIEAGSNPLLSPSGSSYHALGVFLQQLVVQMDLFGESAEAQTLRDELHTLSLPLASNHHGTITSRMPADEWIERAYPVLMEQKAPDGTLVMPLEWPAIGSDRASRLIGKALDCMSQVYSGLHHDTGKFDNRDWRYCVRGFVRLSHGSNCPIRLSWSSTSAPFYIAPWWDGAAPPVKISLPALGDIKDLKPSVSFEMPPELANLLNRDPLDTLAGDGSEPPKWGLGWLCSFSLPIITLCAFIVLNIFLSLFNLFFHWMLWIKVCLPIPAPQPPADEGSP